MMKQLIEKLRSKQLERVKSDGKCFIDDRSTLPRTNCIFNREKTRY